LKKKVIVAIDGPSSSGKSTIAKLVAKHFNFTYIDSGSIYRAITYLALKNNLVNTQSIDVVSLIDLLNNCSISFSFNSNNQNIIKIDDVSVDNEIRTFEISNNVSLIAEKNDIRKYVLKIQKDISKNKSVVMDGRDIGSVVFPNADFKFFLDASLDVRSFRRWNELKLSEKDLKFEDVKKDLLKRDENDINRKFSPLIRCKDSILIDSDHLDVNEVVGQIIDIIDAQFKNKY
jgi:cytidylate kinase